MTITLNNIKNPIVYERLWDDRPKLTISDHIQILKELNVDMIFRANWRFNPMYDSCSNPDIPPNMYQTCIDSGYTRDQQTQIISAIKQVFPDMTIIGAVPAQKINKVEINTVTGKKYSDTYYMALDPLKWGISTPSKDELQQQMTQTVSAGGWYPDITNSDYQELLLSWIDEQVMTGITDIWIDLLYTQAGLMYRYTEDMNHFAVKDAYNAANNIIEQIHNSYTSIGIGTWDNPVTSFSKEYGILPELNFVTGTPSVNEVKNVTIIEADWTSHISSVRDIFGNIPYFVFIDWASAGAQIDEFGKLSIQQASDFLEIISNFCNNNNLKFIFPVHGGVSTTSTYNWYDAKEKGTYDAIESIMTGVVKTSSNKNIIIIASVGGAAVLLYMLMKKK